jgi:hypothetical protein
MFSPYAGNVKPTAMPGAWGGRNRHFDLVCRC